MSRPFTCPVCRVRVNFGPVCWCCGATDDGKPRAPKKIRIGPKDKKIKSGEENGWASIALRDWEGE
jgi:hypothetical protein